MTNAPTRTEKSKTQRDNIKNATKDFDYTTIADRLRTISWSNSRHPTGDIYHECVFFVLIFNRKRYVNIRCY